MYFYNNITLNNLKKSGYKHNIDFQHNVFAQAQKRKSNRGCKIIYLYGLAHQLQRGN